MVNADVPVKSLSELVAYAKANPGKLSYGSAGAGTMSNLTGELFKQLAGLPNIVHIPYKGSNPAFHDLVSGHIPMMVFNISDQAVELHKAGKVRILAVASDKRAAPLPDVPTAAEAGYPAFVAQLFIGLFAPAATPAPIIEQISSETQRVMADKEFLEKLVGQGFRAGDRFDACVGHAICPRRDGPLGACAEGGGDEGELTSGSRAGLPRTH